nr:38K protein [Menippe mercenaria nudivirus]
MEKKLFIEVCDIVDVKKFRELMKMCSALFTHIYLLDRSAYVSRILNAYYIDANTNIDHPGIYKIRNINNNIKCYSFKIIVVNNSNTNKINDWTDNSPSVDCSVFGPSGGGEAERKQQEEEKEEYYEESEAETEDDESDGMSVSRIYSRSHHGRLGGGRSSGSTGEDDNTPSNRGVKKNNAYDRDVASNVHVDYRLISLCSKFNVANLKRDIEAQLNTFFNHPKKAFDKASVVVFDLDDTLIDCDYDIIIDDLNRFLLQCQRLFDLVVLWSHGCPKHVNHAFSTSMAEYRLYFTDVFAKTSSFVTNNKGCGKLLAMLNRKYGVQCLKETMLVDDQLCNYNNDYDLFMHAPSTSKKHSSRMWEMLNEVSLEIAGTHTF